MQLSPHKTSNLGDTGVTFPKLESWHPVSKVATIAAVVNKKRVLCRISLKTLKGKFGALDNAPMDSLAQNRNIVQDAARKLIERNNYEEDGSILIRLEDL
jgi:hypothetical protein